jgi:putative transposase
MPRKLRVEYPGAIDHVMSRGDRREVIFLDDVDRQDFLKTLAEACPRKRRGTMEALAEAVVPGQ